MSETNDSVLGLLSYHKRVFRNFSFHTRKQVSEGMAVGLGKTKGCSHLWRPGSYPCKQSQSLRAHMDKISLLNRWIRFWWLLSVLPWKILTWTRGLPMPSSSSKFSTGAEQYYQRGSCSNCAKYSIKLHELKAFYQIEMNMKWHFIALMKLESKYEPKCMEITISNQIVWNNS